VLAANVVSITGKALTQLGVPWFVLQSTGSAGKAGIVAFCATLPIVLSSMAAGPVIDVIGRRRIGIVSDLVRGVAVAAVPLLQSTGSLRFWMLCALMAVAGLFEAPDRTARDVLLPTLADRAGMTLTRAAGSYDGAARCAGMIGAAVGGLLIAVLGAAQVLLLDAASFAVSGAGIAWRGRSPAPATVGGGVTAHLSARAGGGLSLRGAEPVAPRHLSHDAGHHGP
jgi:MFS family permease